MSAIAKINLTINQNWEQLITVGKTLQAKAHAGKLPEANWIESYQDYRYDLNEFGSVQFFDPITDPTDPKFSTVSYCGKIVEGMLPWSRKFRQDFADLNLVTFTYLETAGNITKHCDRLDPETAHLGHCRVIYVINDTNAVTYAELDGHIESYPSRAKTAWLLDTSKPHWIENNQIRQVLQITFHEPFAKVQARMSGLVLNYGHI